MPEFAPSLNHPNSPKHESNLETDLQTMTFEKAMADLEHLVRRLEEGRLSLEEAIEAYERGTLLKNHCESKLRAAKLKVEYILKDQPPPASEQNSH